MKLNFVRPKSVNLRHYKAIRERMFPSEKQEDPLNEETTVLIANETIENRTRVTSNESVADVAVELLVE